MKSRVVPKSAVASERVKAFVAAKCSIIVLKNPQTFRLAGTSQAQHESAAFILTDRYEEFDD